MKIDVVLTLAVTGALVAGLSQAGTPAGTPAARPSGELVLLCYANKASATTGTARLFKASAVDRYLDKGNCRVPDGSQPGDACVRTDPDGDDVCGTDGMTCGDGHGPGGSDNPCACGDTVATDTTLDPGFDPVASSVCAGNGLIVGAGVRLDLGTTSLTGSDNGDGLRIAHGGEAIGGTVAGFGTGIRIVDATPGTASRVANTIVEGNANDGVVVNLADAESRAHLDNLVVRGNGDDGIHALGGPGISNLDVAGDTFTPDGYGLLISGTDTQIASNGAHGLHFGDPAQARDLAAFVDLGEIHGNVGNGVRVEQKTGLGPGADCGASANWPGCTGVTLHGLIVHDNGDAGVAFTTAFLIPRRIGETRYGLGFTSNKVFHNAMGPGCSGPQTQPQVIVTGPAALGPESCRPQDAPPTTQEECDARNVPVNRHCFWTGSTCIVVWDLRGALDCGDNTAAPNAIHSYNTNTDPVGSSELSVGMYARAGDGGLGADVWADNNSWRTGDEAQNVDQDAASFIDADTICPAGGILLQCSSQ